MTNRSPYSPGAQEIYSAEKVQKVDGVNVSIYC